MGKIQREWKIRKLGGGDGFGMLIIYSRNVSLALLGNHSILMLSDLQKGPGLSPWDVCGGKKTFQMCRNLKVKLRFGWRICEQVANMSENGKLRDGEDVCFSSDRRGASEAGMERKERGEEAGVGGREKRRRVSRKERRNGELLACRS